MKPRIQLAAARLSGGGQMGLYVHDGDYSISYNGQELMHSKGCYSEYRMGGLCREIPSTRTPVRILIGGLGLGYTLRGVVEVAGPAWEIVVAELVPEVIAWNRGLLAELNGNLLADSRVKTVEADVAGLIRADGAAGSYDGILLDVDNGPVAMVKAGNRSLYSPAGIRSIHKALKPGGRAVFWSAGPDDAFATRLRNQGFAVSMAAERRHPSAKRPSVTLFIADKAGA